MKVTPRFEFVNKCILPAAILLITIVFSSFKPNRSNEPFQIKIKIPEFYVSSITDSRADTKGEGINVLQQIAKQKYPEVAGLRPVIINVKKLVNMETVLPDGRIDGKIDLSFAFELKTSDDMAVHLVNYNGSSHYIRGKQQTNVARAAIENTVVNALAFFEAWAVKQRNDNPLLARKTAIVFSDYEDKNDADTVYYGTDCKLTWADFKDKPRNSRFAAEVIPGMGYTEKVGVSNGVVKIELAMKVFLPKSAAWVKESYMDDATLNHEQRHFDIVKIVSEHFKQQLAKQNLPVLNYDGYINVAYFDALREIDKTQKSYDQETQHGTYTFAQEKWDKKIDEELKSYKDYAAVN